MIIKILVGLFAGITASMGLGGGFVLLIYLVAIEGLGQTQAQSINLLFFISIAAAAIVIHIKNRLIELKLLPIFIGFGIIGVICGMFLVDLVSIKFLTKIFAVFLAVIGIKELFQKDG